MSIAINPRLGKQVNQRTSFELLETGVSSSSKPSEQLDLHDRPSRKEIDVSVVNRICCMPQNEKSNSSNNEIQENTVQIQIPPQLLINAYFSIKNLEEELENLNSKLALAKRDLDHAISDLALSQRNHRLELTRQEKEINDLKENLANLNRVIAQQENRLQSLVGEEYFPHNAKSPL